MEHVSLWDWTEFFHHEMGPQVGVSPPVGWVVERMQQIPRLMQSGGVRRHGNRIPSVTGSPPEMLHADARRDCRYRGDKSVDMPYGAQNF